MEGNSQKIIIVEMLMMIEVNLGMKRNIIIIKRIEKTE